MEGRIWACKPTLEYPLGVGEGELSARNVESWANFSPALQQLARVQGMQTCFHAAWSWMGWERGVLGNRGWESGASPTF